MTSSPAHLPPESSSFISLALADSYFVDGNFEKAVDVYTAAICQSDERHGGQDVLALQCTRFRSLSHRASAYLALSKHSHAYNDAKAALSLFPSHGDFLSEADQQNVRKIRYEEMAACHDHLAQAALALSSTGGFEEQLRDEARIHWESALTMAGMMMNSSNNNNNHNHMNDCNPVEQNGDSFIMKKYRKCLEDMNEIHGKKFETSIESSDVDTPSFTLAAQSMVHSVPSIASTITSQPTSPTPTTKNSLKTADKASQVPKYQYYQDEQYMKIQILEANMTPSSLSVTITPSSLTVLLLKKGTWHTVICGSLYEKVVVDKCRTIYKEEKVLIKLKKLEKFDWNKLLEEGKKDNHEKNKAKLTKDSEGEEKVASNQEGERAIEDLNGIPANNTPSDSIEAKQNNHSAPTPKKSSVPRPYASHRDWDAIDRDLRVQEESEKPEGDEALNKLFKQVYANASEDTRRAMVKSMQTSGGTVLSTNWDEVQKTDYEKERTAPKGMEWKTYEGDKLPTKDD